ncbi:class I SAM-dependent methyltransferase [Alsobacter sp. R-9]
MSAAQQIPPTVDFEAIKSRQKSTWASGDYAIIGTTLQIVGETLCEAVDLRAGQRVLDVAAGNGNATLAAARRFADVVSTDYVGALLERGRDRARAERLMVDFQEADAEALPFPDGSFDVVLSTFGIMFTPDHARTARELARVCRSGGRIGLANWTPDGFIGRLFKVIGTHVPPPAGVKSPALWGTEPYVAELFGRDAEVASTRRFFTFRYRSPAHFVDLFRAVYGPVHKAFASLDPAKAEALEHDILALIGEFNTARDGTVVVPSAYLEIVATRC